MNIHIDLKPLTTAAWEVREHAASTTKVGCAVLSEQGNIYTGCNIGHRFRCHDIHAEPNALSTMKAAGDGPALAVIIVAERENFTPCGGCLDWIFELGRPSCVVGFQPKPDAPVAIRRADELMPHYPS